jgi:hypothetical protein
VTKTILSYLSSKGWNIVAYDFPQSGTWIMLHPDRNYSEKNKGGIIPDIVAVKEGVCLFFENKDRFYYPDYIKVQELITDNIYKKSIFELVGEYKVHTIRYGIGLPTNKYTRRAEQNKHLVDFVVGVNEDGLVETIYDKHKVL